MMAMDGTSLDMNPGTAANPGQRSCGHPNLILSIWPGA